jgi:uncharacterized membrane protein SirB2
VTLFESLKLTHVSCAFLSIAGFSLRGYWMATDNPLLRRRAVKVLPHLVDTVLLVSAIALLAAMRLSPLAAPWLMVKIAALLLYIGLGMVALRFGRTKQARISAWLLALLTTSYLVSVAYSKSPQGYFGALL